MGLKLFSAALVAAACLGGIAQATEIATERPATEDLRCVFVALSGGDAKGSETGTAMMVGYYLGRFESREPHADVAASLDRTARDFDKMSDADFKKAVQGCFDRMHTSQTNFGDWLKKRS
jgi:hypothetical protein